MIHVTPLSRLAETLEATKANRLLSLLSESTPFERPAHLDAAACLKLTMHDIVEETEGMTAPTLDHVAAVLDFARGWDRAAPLVVHCYAGVSRSTAAAYAIAAALQPERDERELALLLRKSAPSATPNIRIVGFADELLNRGGRMTAAIRAIGRGEEVSEGVPFSLPLAEKESLISYALR